MRHQPDDPGVDEAIRHAMRQQDVGALFWFVVWIVAIGIVLLAWFVPVSVARAQEGALGDFGVGHAQWHHFYMTGERGEDGKPGPIMRPHQPGVLCCGIDCRPTLARYRNGQWFVLIDGQYDPVPAGRIKQNVFSPNGMAHVCAPKRAGPEPIVPYCFIRPDGGA